VTLRIGRGERLSSRHLRSADAAFHGDNHMATIEDYRDMNRLLIGVIVVLMVIIGVNTGGCNW
jgi:hypothetical protein